MTTADEYRRRVRTRHRAAFRLWSQASRTYREALAVPRRRDTDLRIAVDMLMMQASNTHDAISIVAEHGLHEDAATLTRRLLELSIQATYIAKDESPKVRARRAGSYLAYLWRKLPRKAKRVLPAIHRDEWSGTARSYGRFVRRGAKRWGPDWRTMFKECHAEDLYDSDYEFLSNAAHGASAEQVIRFSSFPLTAHQDRHVSVLLVYSSRYLAILGEHWNELFNIVPQTVVDQLRANLVAWRASHPPPDAA